MLDRFLSHPPLVIAAAAVVVALLAGWRYVEWRGEAWRRTNEQRRWHDDG
jgi:hypothetical protein